MPDTTEAAFRVGLLGYGIAGRVFHAPLIAANPDLTLAAVVTADPQRQAHLRAEHPGAAVLAAAYQLWQRADELDLVVVAAPNRHHVPLTMAALDAGLPVVVDKPLAPTAAEGWQLVDEAHRRGLLITVFQSHRWDGDMLTVRRLIADGALGTVHRFQKLDLRASFGYRNPETSAAAPASRRCARPDDSTTPVPTGTDCG